MHLTWNILDEKLEKIGKLEENSQSQEFSSKQEKIENKPHNLNGKGWLNQAKEESAAGGNTSTENLASN